MQNDVINRKGATFAVSFIASLTPTHTSPTSLVTSEKAAP
jgi:hypothetical protein